jgi:hypothetical protein
MRPVWAGGASVRFKALIRWYYAKDEGAVVALTVIVQIHDLTAFATNSRTRN